MIKENVVHTYYGIYLSNKKEQTLDTCNDMEYVAINTFIQHLVLKDAHALRDFEFLMTFETLLNTKGLPERQEGK